MEPQNEMIEALRRRVERAARSVVQATEVLERARYGHGVLIDALDELLGIEAKKARKEE